MRVRCSCASCHSSSPTPGLRGHSHWMSGPEPSSWPSTNISRLVVAQDLRHRVRLGMADQDVVAVEVLAGRAGALGDHLPVGVGGRVDQHSRLAEDAGRPDVVGEREPAQQDHARLTRGSLAAVDRALDDHGGALGDVLRALRRGMPDSREVNRAPEMRGADLVDPHALAGRVDRLQIRDLLLVEREARPAALLERRQVVRRADQTLCGSVDRRRPLARSARDDRPHTPAVALAEHEARVRERPLAAGAALRAVARRQPAPDDQRRPRRLGARAAACARSRTPRRPRPRPTTRSRTHSPVRPRHLPALRSARCAPAQTRVTRTPPERRRDRGAVFRPCIATALPVSR